MKFSLKNLFRRKGKKEEAPPPAAPETAAPAPVKEEPPKRPSRLGELDLYKEPEGYYLINLNVGVPANVNGHYMHIMKSPETGFMLADSDPRYLAGCKTVAMQVEEFMERVYQLDVGHVYYKRKDANFFFDGYDELLGLPPGDGFQMVLVPEGSEWKPSFCPPPLYAIPGTGTVYQHPATLLPQFQPAVNYPIIMVNGYDITQPVLPEIPGAQPIAEQVAANASDLTKPKAAATEEPKPEGKTETPAPAAAPPPPKPQ
ncbi:MAG: hypothetical protein EPN97_18190 [Alphaproteobacteria bacterium]|nr:MAG: hypothetical protein EPN97_18190 [Alphaproteobacteria bacterium]